MGLVVFTVSDVHRCSASRRYRVASYSRFKTDRSKKISCAAQMPQRAATLTLTSLFQDHGALDVDDSRTSQSSIINPRAAPSRARARAHSMNPGVSATDVHDNPCIHRSTQRPTCRPQPIPDANAGFRRPSCQVGKPAHAGMIASRWAKKALRDCVGTWPVYLFCRFSLGVLPAGAPLSSIE